MHSELRRVSQSFMASQGFSGWLVHDFRGSNPVLPRLLPGKRWTTRRVQLFVPLAGEPRLLVHHIDAEQFAACGVEVERYGSWRELEAWIGRLAHGRIAMEYSPGGRLPAASFVDAGTVECVRAAGAEVVSSADLIQATVATFEGQVLANHQRAAAVTEQAKDEAFAFLRDRLRAGARATELEAQAVILARFAAAGLECATPPIVAVNGHAGDPHFEPAPHHDAPVRPGDWVLIDLWARVPGDENVHSDITWVACAGAPGPRRAAIYQTVRAARDASLRLAQQRWKASLPVQGWELDDAARHILEQAGEAAAIRHRTGHSLSPGPLVHGLGMNLDNLETRDTRLLLPRLAFTIEPGLYFADFGVRMEINVYADPQRGPVVTSCVQDELTLLA